MVEKGKDLPVSSFGAGLLTTGANPSFFIWWATVGALLVINAALFGSLGVLVFIAVHVSADFLWYGLLSFGTNRSKHLMTPRVHGAIFGVCALLLIVFGAWFVTSVFV
jgi:threonine/homoserine/homoserine lactone efflux protein